MEKSVTILLPTFNERENIVLLINRIRAVMQDRWEIIVIDDNSPDGTADEVRSNFPHDPKVRLIVRSREHGLASAIQRGIDASSGSIIVWMDCDLSMPPEKIPELVSFVANKGFDVAVGSRYCSGGADRRPESGKAMLRMHTVLSLLLTRLTSLLLCRKFKDWTSGFIAGKKEIIRRFPLTGDYGEYFIALMYQIINSGYRFIEVPYELTARQHGISKTARSWVDFYTRGIKYLAMVYSLKRKKGICYGTQ